MSKKKRKKKKEIRVEQESSLFDRGVKVGISLLILATALAYSPYTYYYDGIKYYIFVGGTALLAAWTSIWLLRKKELTLSLWKDDLPILGLLIFALLSLTQSNYVLMSLRQGIFLFLYLFIFYLLRAELRKDESGFGVLENVIAVAGFLVGGYVVLQYYGIYIWLGSGNGSPPTLYSTMGHQNFAAHYAAYTFPFLLVKFLKGKGKTRWVWGALTVIQSLGIFLTQSRGGFVAWGASIFALLWFAWRGGIIQKAVELKKRIGAIVVVSAVVLFIYTIPSPLTHGVGVGRRIVGTVEKLSTGATYQATSGRSLIWKSTLRMIKDHPLLGVGLGRFGYHYPFYQAEFLKGLKGGGPLNAKRTHNEYLQVLAETGIGGFICFVLFLFFLYKRLVLLLRKKGSENLGFLALASGISAGLVGAFFSFPFHLPANGPLLAAFFASAYGLSDPLVERWKELKLRERWQVATVFLPFLVLSSWLFYYDIRAYKSQVLAARCYVLTRKHKTPQFVNRVIGPMADKAVQLDPTEKMAQFALARAYMIVKNWRMAEKEWKRFFKLESDWNAMINYAVTLAKLKKFKEAEKVAREIIKIQPHLVDGYNLLGGVLIEEGKYKEAEKWLKKAIEVKPDYARPYYNLAFLYNKLGKKEKALKYLEEAEKRKPPKDLIPKIKALKRVLSRGKAASVKKATSSINLPEELIKQFIEKYKKQ